jgi:hypothetical protein
VAEVEYYREQDNGIEDEESPEQRGVTDLPDIHALIRLIQRSIVELIRSTDITMPRTMV